MWGVSATNTVTAKKEKKERTTTTAHILFHQAPLPLSSFFSHVPFPAHMHSALLSCHPSEMRHVVTYSYNEHTYTILFKKCRASSTMRVCPYSRCGAYTHRHRCLSHTHTQKKERTFIVHKSDSGLGCIFIFTRIRPFFFSEREREGEREGRFCVHCFNFNFPVLT